MDWLTDLLWISTPLWFSGGMALLLVVNAWQHWQTARTRDQAIENLHQWADAVDECLDRLDWAKHRQTPLAAKTQNPWWQPWWQRRGCGLIRRSSPEIPSTDGQKYGGIGDNYGLSRITLELGDSALHKNLMRTPMHHSTVNAGRRVYRVS